MNIELPTWEEIESARVFVEADRCTSARWFVLNGKTFHSRCAGHLEMSSHSPEYVIETHYLREVSS